jgi:hypothetical protein
MVEYAMTIEDREERTRCAHTIINIMGNLFPHLRDVNDFKHKLWDHLAIMSDYKLDIDYPYELVKPEKLESKPEKLPYPNRRISHRHYGTILPRFVEAVNTLDEENEVKLIPILANHMKKCFIVWNKESSVEDQKIFADLYEISNGRLSLSSDNLKLKEGKDLIGPANINMKKNINNNIKNKPKVKK